VIWYSSIMGIRYTVCLIWQMAVAVAAEERLLFVPSWAVDCGSIDLCSISNLNLLEKDLRLSLVR